MKTQVVRHVFDKTIDWCCNHCRLLLILAAAGLLVLAVGLFIPLPGVLFWAAIALAFGAGIPVAAIYITSFAAVVPYLRSGSYNDP